MNEQPPNYEKWNQEMMESLRKMFKDSPSSAQPETEKIQTEEPETTGKHRDRLKFNLKPKEVKKYLDRYVIKQEDAKRVLATAVCDHYNHVKQCDENPSHCRTYFKQNVIMLGPTGVGKTHLIRHLAELIGVPFVKADATKFSETGYVGGDVEDLIRELVQKSDGDLELAQYGIVYLDEVDKISSPYQLSGRDVSGSGVQRGLLKIMEETEVSLRNPQDIQSQLQAVMEYQKKGKVSKSTINTRHILFIVSGAFDGLIPIIEKRIRQKQIGFTQENNPKTPEHTTSLLKLVQTEDFMQFGFESEFIGRLPIRVICHPLSEEDLHRILISSEDSILYQYKAAFQAYGIEMQLEDPAIWEIAKQAAREKTGARGLFTVCEQIFRSLKYELPSSRITRFTLSREEVLHPQAALKQLLREEHSEKSKEVRQSVRHYEEAFLQQSGLRIEFSPEAIEAVNQIVCERDESTEKVLNTLLTNYKYGLELIKKKKSRNHFLIPREAVENPNALLDQWIKEAYDS